MVTWNGGSKMLSMQVRCFWYRPRYLTDFWDHIFHKSQHLKFIESGVQCTFVALGSTGGGSSSVSE